VHPDVAGLPGIETAEEGRLPLLVDHPHLNQASFGAADENRIVLVGAVDLNVVGELLVELPRRVGQTSQAFLEGERGPARRDLAVLVGEPVDGIVDGRVGDPGLNAPHRFLPLGPLEFREMAAVDKTPLPGQAEDARISRSEVDEPRLAGADQREKDPRVSDERLVAILGHRLPEIRALAARPLPLVLVAIEVVDEQIEKARAQEGLCVHLLFGVIVEPLPKLHRIEEFVEVLEPRGHRLLGADLLFDKSKSSAELLAERAEPVVVGQEHEPVGGAEDPRGFGKGIDHHRPKGMSGTHLVLNDGVDECVAQFLGQDGRGVLVDGAELPFATLAAFERERRGLFAAPPLFRPQAAREGAEVEDFDLEVRLPEVAIALPEEEPVQGARGVVTARGDDLRVLRLPVVSAAKSFLARRRRAEQDHQNPQGGLQRVSRRLRTTISMTHMIAGEASRLRRSVRAVYARRTHAA
jgi:hypothetical protein